MLDSELKKCTKCKEEKPTTDFYFKDEDSLRPECIECYKDSAKKYASSTRQINRKLYEDGELKPPIEKWCKVCDEIKPPEDFYMNFQSKELLSSYCKSCHKKDTAQRKSRKSKAKKLEKLVKQGLNV